jgi:hypothetical protein
VSYKNILYDVDDRLATITLNRPERRNANIDSELLSLSKTLVNRIFEQQGFSSSIKSSGEFIGYARRLKSSRGFRKTSQEKGLKAALEERDRPFGGVVGRYPPAEE